MTKDRLLLNINKLKHIVGVFQQTLAKQLPITFTEVRAMFKSSSMPMMMEIGSTSNPNEAVVPINTFRWQQIKLIYIVSIKGQLPLAFLI